MLSSSSSHHTCLSLLKISQWLCHRFTEACAAMCIRHMHDWLHSEEELTRMPSALACGRAPFASSTWVSVHASLRSASSSASSAASSCDVTLSSTLRHSGSCNTGQRGGQRILCCMLVRGRLPVRLYTAMHAAVMIAEPMHAGTPLAPG